MRRSLLSEILRLQQQQQDVYKPILCNMIE